MFATLRTKKRMMKTLTILKTKTLPIRPASLTCLLTMAMVMLLTWVGAAREKRRLWMAAVGLVAVEW